MQRKTLYIWFIVAYFFKAVGGSSDVSYHFKYFRETTQLPHLIGVTGFILLLFLWIYMWKTKLPHEVKSLKVFGYGLILSFVGIPFDEWWHYTFGLDLTIWSPPHMMFYTSTFVTLLGVIGFIEKDFEFKRITVKQRTWLHTIFLAFTMAVLWFPLLQQEQGIIAYTQWMNGESIASQELKDMIVDPKAQIYGGIPDWLYPAWIGMVSLFAFALTKHLNLYRFATTTMVLIYLTFRTIMNTIYDFSIYPTSTIPYTILLAAILFDILYRKDKGFFQYLWITPLLILAFHLIVLVPSGYPLHPPLTYTYMFVSIFTAIFGGFIGKKVTYKLYKKEKETV